MSRLMARIANTSARVTRSVTNGPVCGVTTSTAMRTAATASSLRWWVMRFTSLAPEQAGRLDRQQQGHGCVKGEIGDLGKQRLAEVVGEPDNERPDRCAREASHAADDHDCEGDRQDLEVEAGIDAQEGAADHAAERGE